MATSTDPKSLIAEYQQQNSAAGGPGLKTPDGYFLNGFYIDRKTIEDILNSNPDISGISVQLAKDPSATGKPDNIFTIFLTGAIGTTPPFTASGDPTGTPPPPCPPWCTK
ncbi:MAG: hypothetical protein JST50_02835 [Bacteroidetes bacterium]|jgi:hypothetical protein|nr:hypothetical protein [Bacteroidota bacterium]